MNEISLLSRNLLLHYTHPLTLQKKIESLKHRLIRLHEVLNNKYPGNSHCLPSPEQINIQKLGHGGVIMTDTCNQAQKVRRLICDQVVGALDYDCMNHLRNVWFGATEKGCTKDLNIHLRTSLDEIDPKLRVTTSMSAFVLLTRNLAYQQIILRVMANSSLNGSGNITLECCYCMLSVLPDQDKIYAQRDPWQST